MTTGKFLTAVPADRNKFFNLSVSKVKTFKSCKAKYNFCYILKLPKKEWEHQTFGTFLHEVLESFQKEIISGNEKPDHIIMKDCYKKSLEIWHPKTTKAQRDEFFQILTSYLKHRANLKKEGKLPRPISVEKNFNIQIGDTLLLNGFIDLVLEDWDGVLHVSDYKTSKNDKYLKKDFFQLKTYAYAMFLENPELKKVRCSYCMLRMDFKTLIKEYTREDVMDTAIDFDSQAQEMLGEKLFRPSLSPLCKFCDYIEFCKEGNKKYGVPKITYGPMEW